MSSNTSLFKIGSFSNNHDTISPMSLIKKFFIEKSCKNISYIKSGHVEFDHQIQNSVSSHLHFIEILRLDKKYSICSMADCFIFIIDLESDPTYAKIDKIFFYMKEYCSSDQKIYIIGLYKNQNAIPELMKEDTISSYFESQNCPYDYYELQLDKTSELIKRLDTIIDEVFESKKKALEDSKTKKITRDVDQSGSGCLIY